MVAAAGGFEANLEWLQEAWGDAAHNFIVRGTPWNRGGVLRLLLDAGAQPVGDPAQCHAVAVDARAPKFDGGIVTRLDCLPLGIVVNRFAERFYDEGEDLWPKRYAIWGLLVAQQPDQIAWSITDAKTNGLYMPSVYPPVEANSIAELAGLLGLPAEKLCATVRIYNEAVVAGHFQPCGARQLQHSRPYPEKTHWAQTSTAAVSRLSAAARNTFTYLGVRTDESARVIMKSHEQR